MIIFMLGYPFLTPCFQFEHLNPGEVVESCVKPLVRTCSPFSIRSVRYLPEVFSQSGET